MHSTHRTPLRARVLAMMLFVFWVPTFSIEQACAEELFEIQVVDAETGRGIPLVELTTVDQVTYVTDSTGRIAYHEPGHAGQTIFFSIKSSGYEPTKDGLGFAGTRLKITPGGSETIKIKRLNLAERIYRCTGQGIYRDSVLLGKPTPLKEPMGAGMVAGQDSVFTIPYRGKLWWFWGDTLRLSYPLGHFRMAGATTDLPATGKLDPDLGIDFEYFVGEDGFSRPLAELPERKGVVWLDGFATVPDDAGKEVMVAHFSRRPGLAEAYEQGIMRFNDDRGVLEKVTNLPLDATWTFLRDHPIVWKEGGTEYLVSGNPFPVTRVKRTLADVMRPESYESWSCMDDKGQPLRNAQGKLEWKWRPGPPVTQQIENEWTKKRLIEPGEARYLPTDASRPGRVVLMHSGSTNWNDYRKRWVMVATELAYDKSSPSFLGEVWYSEADSPQGPWKKAVKVATHEKQSFYNPYHHRLFDREQGHVIFFEGTYANTFTDSPPTPRYNYNQLMYKLDLDHPQLRSTFVR